MKKYLVSFLCLSGIASSSYAEKEISLTVADPPSYPPPVNRTPPVIPAVEYEGDMFTVTTPLIVECVPFAIYSEDGTMVYSFTDCEPAHSHSFTVSALIPGETYTVDVTIGSVTWTGDFTWEND